QAAHPILLPLAAVLLLEGNWFGYRASTFAGVKVCASFGRILRLLEPFVEERQRAPTGGWREGQRARRGVKVCAGFGRILRLLEAFVEERQRAPTAGWREVQRAHRVEPADQRHRP